MTIKERVLHFLSQAPGTSFNIWEVVRGVGATHPSGIQKALRELLVAGKVTKNGSSHRTTRWLASI